MRPRIWNSICGSLNAAYGPSIGLDFAVGYVPRDNWRSLFRQIYRYGYGRARMARKHRCAISPPVMMLSLLVLMLTLLPVVALFVPEVWRIWLGIAVSYAGLLALSALWGARRKPRLIPQVFTALAGSTWAGDSATSSA